MDEYRMRRRGRRRGLSGIGGIIWLIIIISVLSSHWIWPMIFSVLPLVFIFFFFLRPRLSNMFGMGNQQPYSQPNYQQQPYQQQPYQQPIYQAPQYNQPQDEQRDVPVYQPYTQGYQPQESAPGPQIYHGSEQQQYPEQQTQQQYEEPLTMYPQD